MASTSALAALAAFETRVDGDAVLLSPGRWHERERPRLPVPPPCELPPPGLWATGREFLYESRERFERAERRRTPEARTRMETRTPAVKRRRKKRGCVGYVSPVKTLEDYFLRACVEDRWDWCTSTASTSGEA